MGPGKFVSDQQEHRDAGEIRDKICARSLLKECSIGHFSGVLEIDGFIDKNEFKKQLDDWIEVSRKAAPNRSLIPGDPKREAEAIRSKDGIPLLQPVVDDLWIFRRRLGYRGTESLRTSA